MNDKNTIFDTGLQELRRISLSNKDERLPDYITVSENFNDSTHQGFLKCVTSFISLKGGDVISISEKTVDNNYSTSVKRKIYYKRKKIVPIQNKAFIVKAKFSKKYFIVLVWSNNKLSLRQIEVIKSIKSEGLTIISAYKFQNFYEAFNKIFNGRLD